MVLNGLFLFALIGKLGFIFGEHFSPNKNLVILDLSKQDLYFKMANNKITLYNTNDNKIQIDPKKVDINEESNIFNEKNIRVC